MWFVCYNDGEIWFCYVSGEGLVGIKIIKIDLDKIGDYICNIVVVYENYILFYDMGVIFNFKWFKLI